MRASSSASEQEVQAGEGVADDGQHQRQMSTDLIRPRQQPECSIVRCDDCDHAADHNVRALIVHSTDGHRWTLRKHVPPAIRRPGWPLRATRRPADRTLPACNPCRRVRAQRRRSDARRITPINRHSVRTKVKQAALLASHVERAESRDPPTRACGCLAFAVRRSGDLIASGGTGTRSSS